MFRFWLTLVKDFRVLTRDKLGLTFMFIMPVLLVVIITSIQDSTFQLVNENRTPLILCNQDGNEPSLQFEDAILKMGMFEVIKISPSANAKQVVDSMQQKDALVAVIIPKRFSEKLMNKSNEISIQALQEFGVSMGKEKKEIQDTLDPITLYYQPVLQESYMSSIRGVLQSALQLVQTREIIQTLYFSINEKKLPEELESAILKNQTNLNEIPISKGGSKNVPNSTQHNIPAWTVFAMFFIVTSLGSNLVRERLSGSFIRLKTLPTNYLTALLSKQLIYLMVCLLQVFIIFSIGIWLFPYIHLPKLNLPSDLLGLFIVSVISGWCAISYAMCIGIFAQTQEQSNGFGAVSIIMLAAIGGILVPSFAMPSYMLGIMKISPLHWCLESYYDLFLEGGRLRDVFTNILPLLAIILVIQLFSFWGLKRKNLI